MRAILKNFWSEIKVEKMKKKGAWSEKEDSMLKSFMEKEGGGGGGGGGLGLNWKSISHKDGLNRCGKSCRLRWKNYLNPLITRGNFSPQEEDLIIRLQSNLGNKWAQIATQLPGRTDNDIKNLWNTKLKKKKLQREAISQLQLQTPINFFSNHDYALIAEAAKNSALQQWMMKFNQEWSWLQLQLQLQTMQPFISNDAWFEAGSDAYNIPTEENPVQIREDDMLLNVNGIGNEMGCELVDLQGVEASTSDVYGAGAICSFYHDHFGVHLSHH